MIPLLLAAVTQAGIAEVYTRPIADTFIDSQAPNTNYGREGFLKGGEGQAILIDFPGLAMGGGKIEEASLVLTALDGLGAELTGVSILRAPWRQGIGGRLVKEDLATNLQGATWTQRGGEAAWQTAGAVGALDSEKIEGAAAAWVDDRLVITGLGEALNAMLEQPATHFGLRLQFGQPCSFASADDDMLAPVLRYKRSAAEPSSTPQVIELKPGANGAWQAAIASQAAGEVIWRLDGKEFARTPFSAGEQPVTATPPAEGASLGVISAEAVVGGASDSIEYSLTAQSVSVTGVPLATAQAAVDYLNQAVFPNSFSVFTPGGVRQRLRLVGDAAQADIKVTASGTAAQTAQAILKQLIIPNRDLPSPGMDVWALTSDARDDSLYLPNVPIPDYGWMPRLQGQPTTPSFGMLGRFEMGMLERLHNKPANDRARFRLPMPTGQIFLRMFDQGGKDLTDAHIKVWRSATSEPQGSPIFDQQNAGPSVLVMMEGGDPRNLVIEITKGGLTERRVIPWTRLSDEAMRVGEGLASLEIRWPLSTEPIDRSKNEAAGALVADSRKNAPVRLISVVDGKPDTSLTIPADGSYWLELDLGRDMRVGEIELVFMSAVPDLIDIQLYQTAEKPEWAVFWMRDRGASSRKQIMEMGNLVRYRSASVPGRYVRIWMNPHHEVKLSEVRVFDVSR